ncbi:MAG TPA: NAD(P)-binding domain-containing protein [Marmoricola sp.]|jgi:putative flavoprotein involved in K+ transport|nr:NAD(P)-binding domain-containing protein [Marmoricola sp.]
MTTTYDTIVIGAGQAGLAAGYHLTTRGKPFLILDGADRIGGSWRNRWDSLTLFTPSIRDSLPGLQLPGTYRFPPKDEMLAYFERYAAHFEMPIRLDTPVDGIFREGDGFRVTSGTEAFLADNVILAVGAHRKPRTPAFAGELSPDIVQLHSADYRNPGQLQPGTVLVVGAGNSGAEIGVDIGRSHRVLLSGRDVGFLPIDVRGWQGRMAFPVIWWVWEHVLTERKKPGRKVQAEALEGHGEPLIRQKEKDLVEAGIERVPRISRVVDGRPQTEDGTVLDVANVVWCTGFTPDFAWIDIPGLDSSGRLASERGVTAEPGLYVIGQQFQYMFNSHTVGGVGKDAAYVVRHIDERAKAEQGQPQPA